MKYFWKNALNNRKFESAVTRIDLTVMSAIVDPYMLRVILFGMFGTKLVTHPWIFVQQRVNGTISSENQSLLLSCYLASYIISFFHNSNGV